jgi:cellulose synthase/poly-beta-1,6-N-acetylglucosamine synthase-like glycosyltransferase
MTFFFWLFLSLIFYTYIGYPVALKFAADAWRMPDPVKKEITPSVSIVVPAYNEEEAIGQKLTNLLALDYPKAKMEIVVVSDCSSDRTDEIVRSFEWQGVRLHRRDSRGGKIAGYKSVLPTLTGQIVVFSDATSKLALDSLRKLVRNFADESVGCVAGRLYYIDPEKAEIAQGEQAYWSYESSVKQWEEKVYSLTSVSGTFYAVRKELFPLDMDDDLADDLIVVLHCVKNGHRVILEKDAICQEFAIHADEAEMNKRWRITVQNLRGLFSIPEVMDVRRYGWYAGMIISHKLFRMLVPFFLMGVLFTNIFLVDGSAFFKAVLLAQIIFYLCGVIAAGWTEKRPKSLNIIYYFCVTNLAILIGVIKFFKGEKVAVWETAR